MFLIIVCTGVLFFFMLNKAKKPIRQCEKVHKWTLRFDNGDKRGYLVCKDCGKIPGED